MGKTLFDFDREDLGQLPPEAPRRPVFVPPSTTKAFERKILAQHTSDSVEHYTPGAVVEVARTLMGGIDLDPASSWLANQTVRAKGFYGHGKPELVGWDDSKAFRPEMHKPGPFVDGLNQSWHGNVWLNPPGGATSKWAPHLCGVSKSYGAIWWGKLYSEWAIGNVTQGVFLGFSLELLLPTQNMTGIRPPTDFPICFPKVRIPFGYPEDTVEGLPTALTTVLEGKEPTHGNFIVWLPPFDAETAPYDFRDAFGHMGACK